MNKLITSDSQNRGAWLSTDKGLLSVVEGHDGQPTFVGLYPGCTDHSPKGLPYALSLNDEGEVLLQIPGPTPADTKIVKVSDIVQRASLEPASLHLKVGAVEIVSEDGRCKGTVIKIDGVEQPRVVSCEVSISGPGENIQVNIAYSPLKA